MSYTPIEWQRTRAYTIVRDKSSIIWVDRRRVRFFVFVQGDTLVDRVPGKHIWAPYKWLAIMADLLIQGVPHCSIHNLHTPADEAPRESTEAQCSVFYD